ncbi:hypothetical protein MS3_00003357 [Schistosoma haematobium]|uniref:Glycosyltransferase-related protein n=1 Tax=Schistosoma haematobium TaxID=6185 RepID=A0A922LPG0_SCHHA|nr:hypothetical protein MS3_00003357 [Schistosoma haematobium]KAH9590834.1 hypothetical protein MS3_00003357 [Schistosoma haematobium]CAH8662529.1 unnamed protein product [Schistosoma haematobium]
MKVFCLKRGSSPFKSRSFVITITGLIITVFIYLLSMTVLTKDIKNTQNLQKVTKNNKIHIVSLIEGDKDFNYINVLIKSILYHQKRFHCQNNKCCLGDLCKRSKTVNFPCSHKKILKTDGSITFHFITDKPTRLKFQKMEQSWQLINVKFQFYEYQHYLDKIDGVLSKRSSGIKSCLKLLLPEILPKSVKQVIVLDTCLLLNTDINELWDHFRYFKSSHILGVTMEQNPEFEVVMKSLIRGWRGYGYNSGVVLMDLAKLRSAAWNHLWMSAIKFVMKATRYLSAGEQGVINLIMFRNNETFYKIPCEWNIQLSSGVDVHRCPVSWLAENSLLNNRDLMYGKQPKIVYLNHQVKPEYLDLENILNVDTNVSLTNYNANLLYMVYLKEYFKYRHISQKCFY